MTPQEVVDCCLQKPGAYLDAPFGPEVTVVKVGRLGDRPGRIFAQVFRLRGQDTVTLCCTEKMGFVYRGLFPEVVVRGYHCPPVQQPLSLIHISVPPEEIKRVKGMGFLHNKGTGRFNARIITRNGRVTAHEMACVAHAAERFGDGHVVMTTRLTLEVTGVPYGQIDAFRAFVGEAGLETGGTGSKVRPVVSCKGTTCQYGLIDTYALSEKIHRRFYEGYRDVQLPHKFKIAVGGCPNNCVKPDLNDLGIVGARVPLFDADRCRACGKCTLIDACPVGAAARRGLADARAVIDTERCNSCGRCIGKCVFKLNDAARPGYRVLIGGRWGKAFAQGRALRHLFLSEEEVLLAVESAILLFRDQGLTGERFADTVARISFDEAERQILSGELLTRREEILGRRVVGGATC